MRKDKAALIVGVILMFRYGNQCVAAKTSTKPFAGIVTAASPEAFAAGSEIQEALMNASDFRVRRIADGSHLEIFRWKGHPTR